MRGCSAENEKRGSVGLLGFWLRLVVLLNFCLLSNGSVFAFDTVGNFCQSTDEIDSGNVEYTPKPVESRLLYMRQDGLLKRSLESVAATKPGQPQFYFVGVAPSDTQIVFAKEVFNASVVFAKEFHAEKTSALLINNEITSRDVALATIDNLGILLKGIAEKMNINQDVLVLYITTHGNVGILENHLTGTSLPVYTPRQIRMALDQSGIKYRVIIISACHSGSFIPALANKNTLIMTAARADRTSFGCSNKREWTYFGDALFNHAFRETHSFSEAFEKASALVKTWEVADGADRSFPQISVGKAIAVKLSHMMEP